MITCNWLRALETTSSLISEMTTNFSDSSAAADYPIVIVGAGVAGVSAAYHLVQSGAKKILIVDEGISPGEGPSPRKAGSATMTNVAPRVKMMVQVFAGSTQEFERHHGSCGAKKYLSATRQGISLQKDIAKSEIWNKNQSQWQIHLRELGSYYVAYEHEEKELHSEYQSLKSLGCHDVEWIDKDGLQTVEGMSQDFHCAIHFPSDAIIDSSAYAKGLLKRVIELSDGKAELLSQTRVRRVTEDSKSAIVEFDSGRTIKCKHLVMATGGLFQIPQLNGLMKPCYSYLVQVPIDSNEAFTKCDASANFFTWGFSHDWCFTNGGVRCSGEDHFSAYKPPLCAERCEKLSQWTLRTYGCQDKSASSMPQQYGIYSETPDMVPLIGHITENSRVCYLLGCNAWGQAILSYSSSLVPGLLNYAELSENQKDILDLLSIRRFSHLPT